MLIADEYVHKEQVVCFSLPPSLNIYWNANRYDMECLQ